VGKQVRQRLETEWVVRTSVKGVHRVLRPRRAEIWLTSGGGPRLAAASGDPSENGPAAVAPDAVLKCVRKRRAVDARPEGGLAVPLAAPRSGFLGVLHADGVQDDPNHRRFVEGVARETALALEAAELYERAVAEKEKTQAILARTGDSIVVTDAHGHVREWNEAAERIMGCPRQHAVGRRCSEALGLRIGEHALDCTHSCQLLAAQEEADGSSGHEVWRMRDDGRRQPLLASVESVRDAEGNISEVVHSLRDITRLKEADEAKTMFLATASHELKTPLTVIQGFSEMLTAKSELSDRDRRALEAVHSRALELNDIVDRVLLSSRIEAGQTDVELEEVELRPMLAERVEALRLATDRDVVASIDPALPAALADKGAVVTVVDHLLDNAVKYSPEGGSVTLSAGANEIAVVISIADDGVGMDPEQASRCFDKFWQAESSDVRRFGGTGIGLHIVRSLAEAMGGQVGVESTLGKGSRFSLSLPRPGFGPPPEEPEQQTQPPPGEKSIVREFMRQIGVPERRDT
jgi:PAS domain S-box-containing protein